jgi:predicted nucleic acid-binding protein
MGGWADHQAGAEQGYEADDDEAVRVPVGVDRLGYRLQVQAERGRELLAPFREITVDRAVAERAGRVAREFQLRLPDALIAATALENRLTLTTRNREDFDKVRGLRIRTP